jgi:hypothetical protein
VPRIRVVPTVVSGRCRFEVPVWSGAAALRILDISGRVVSEVPIGLEPSGRTRAVSWSATDNSGRPVPNGVYFATASGPSYRSSAKFLVQR